MQEHSFKNGCPDILEAWKHRSSSEVLNDVDLNRIRIGAELSRLILIKNETYVLYNCYCGSSVELGGDTPRLSCKVVKT